MNIASPVTCQPETTASQPAPTVVPAGPHILVIGSGPAGVRFAHEYLRRQPTGRVTLFGDEPFRPYNRVKLSLLLAGDISCEQIEEPLPAANHHPFFHHLNQRIQMIDTDNQCVFDQQQNRYNYDRLVLATGSRPHIPHIPGTDQSGVYTFRNMKDAEYLYGRAARARHLVIVGGGLLGLEAARALQRFNTQVTVIQQGPRLMNRQLDDIAADHLLRKLESMQIHVITDSGVRKILGDGRVTGVVTRDGTTLNCDTVLLCAGIKPAIELARNARIKVGTGILVDDHLRTSADQVYAIGECCEHRGKTYGLVNPGFEQAAICADILMDGPSQYVGSLEISRLKVVGETICSMGEAADVAPRPFLKQWTYTNRSQGIYRKLVTYRGRLIGAVGYAGWPELRRIQEAYQFQRRVLPWQILRFLLTGNLWGNDSANDVNGWPAATIVCQCNNINLATLSNARAEGATNAEALTVTTGAGSVCGSCKPLLQQLCGDDRPTQKEPGSWLLNTGALATLLVIVLFLFVPPIPVSDTVQHPNFLEPVWNNKFWKQVTGFSMLGLVSFGMLMSLRKRMSRFGLGKFVHWRTLHIVTALLSVLLLIAHTGLHTGINLNRWLLTNFLMVLAAGSLASLVMAFNHKMSTGPRLRWRRWSLWGHLLLTWPLPVLITAHIISVYFF